MNPLAAAFIPLVKEPDRSGAAGSPGATGAVENSVKADPREAERLAQAGRDFEAVLVRYMLRSLEKTSSIAGAKSAAAGQSTYRSMMVDAVATAIAAGDGLGLGTMFVHELEGRLAPASASSEPAQLVEPVTVGKVLK